MAPRSIVETFDVGEDVTSGVLPCCIVLVMDELGVLSVWKKLSIGHCRSNRPCGSWTPGSRRTATHCDTPPKHIERRDRNGGSGQSQAAAPRWPCAGLPAAARCANDPPSPSRRSCGCTNP